MKKGLALGACVVMMALSACSSSGGTSNTSEVKPAAEVSLESLTGNWEMTQLALNGEDSVDTTGVTMEVDNTGSFMISNECNNPRGTFTVSDGVLGTEGPVITTMMFCEGLPGERETVITSVLDPVSGGTLSESGELQVIGDKGTMTFQRK